MAIPVVAVVGRPNVGKSALFNRLVGANAAIVSDEAGTTRDRHFGRVEWNAKAFWLVDTGGIVEDSNVPMDVEIRKQVVQAIGEADLVVIVADAKVGAHPSDARVVDLVRDSGKPFLLAANKVDNPQSTDFYDMYRLGAGDPIPVSAANGTNSGDLLDEITDRLPDQDEAPPEALRVAVVGRPNVGKSSFVNRLLGEERLVVSDIAGTTRDAIDTPTRYHERDLIFIDTAGLRRQSKVDEGVEFYSTLRTRRAIEGCDICVLMVDATLGVENQDLKIATLAWEQGRSLILVVNKWDLKEKDGKTADKFKKDLVEKVPYFAWVPFLFTSAITGQRVHKVLDLILEVEKERNKRIPTSQINEALEEMVQRRQPPQAAGNEVRLIYATQVETAPPSIAVFGNHPDLVQEHYIRYLHNGFRERYGFIGNPLRILMRHKSAPNTDHRRVRA
jgi:GTPase